MWQPAKTPRHALATAASREAGRNALQMPEHRPENLLRQTRVALLVGVGKVVAAGRRGAAQCDQKAVVQAQAIADIVEPDGMGKLRIEETQQMAPRRKDPGLLVHARLPRQLRHEVGRNQIANLPQHSKLAAAWFGVGFHRCRVAGKHRHSKPFSLPAMGWLWGKIRRDQRARLTPIACSPMHAAAENSA